MIAFSWMMVVRFLSLFVRRPKTVRWVCACGFRKREQAVYTNTRICPYCQRVIVPEVLR